MLEPGEAAGQLQVPEKRWLDAISSLHTWERGGQRAPHKPLMLLWLLARAARGDTRRVQFAEISEPLIRLLREFGPKRRSYHPEYPFWHLQHDGLWAIDCADALPFRKGASYPSRATLLRQAAVGHVPDDLWNALIQKPALVQRLQQDIMEEFWPETVHESLRQAIGLPDCSRQVKLRKCAVRDPAFREEVLRAYERRCAVCGYDGRLNDIPLGLDAAHVRWHAYNGPDSIENGVALCRFHHVALDSGAMGMAVDGTILVSCDVSGTQMVEEFLLRFAGKILRKPISNYPTPDLSHTEWHIREVFKSPSR